MLAGLGQGFGQGLQMGEQFQLSREQRKQQRHNLLKSQILDKYLDQHEQDAIRQAQDAHLSAQQAFKLAPQKMTLALQNAQTRQHLMNLSQARIDRYNSAFYKTNMMGRTLGAQGRNIVFSGTGAAPAIFSMQNLLQQAARESIQPHGAAVPGQQSQQQGALPGGIPFSPQAMGIPADRPKYLGPPLGAQTPLNMPPHQDALAQHTANMAQNFPAPGNPIAKQVPTPAPAPTEAPPGVDPLPAALSPIHPDQLDQMTKNLQRASKIAANKAAVSPAIWNRAANARVLDAQFNDSGIRDLAKTAAGFAGTKGGASKVFNLFNQAGTPAYDKYQQFIHITVPNISNQIRQMESLSVQPSQRKEIEGMLAGWNQGLNL